MRRKRSVFESAKFLLIIGILAGAVGGLAIGALTNKSASSAASATH